jgi:hypothetical protein
MFLLTWKYAFSIKPYNSCNSRIYLSMLKRILGLHSKKIERKREEKVRRERERKGQVSY